MPRIRALMVAALLALLGLVAQPPPARACSVPGCVTGDFLPESGATVPSNTPALYWRQADFGQPAAEPTEVVLTAEGQPEQSIPFEAVMLEDGGYALMLEQGLTEGVSYRLVDESECYEGDPVQETSFTASASAPLPEELGTLVASPEGVGLLDLGIGVTCTTQVDADRVAVSLEPSAEVEPWFDILTFTTLVDGEPWVVKADLQDVIAPGASWVGPGEDRLYAVCDDDYQGGPYPGLSEGEHEVVMRASLGGMVLETPPITVELDCGGGGSWGGSPGGGCIVAGRDAPLGGAAAGLVAGILAMISLRRRPAGRR